MSERETNQMLHEYEQRIKELKASLRQIQEAAELPQDHPDDAVQIIDRIHGYASAALQHDHIEHGKGWV